MTVLKLNGEVLTSLCNNCKCCLGKNKHCADCHSNLSIAELCACGNCVAMVEEFAAREATRTKNRQIKHNLEARLRNS